MNIKNIKRDGACSYLREAINTRLTELTMNIFQNYVSNSVYTCLEEKAHLARILLAEVEELLEALQDEGAPDK